MFTRIPSFTVATFLLCSPVLAGGQPITTSQSSAAAGAFAGASAEVEVKNSNLNKNTNHAVGVGIGEGGNGGSSSIGPIQNKQTTNVGGNRTVLNNNTVYPVQVPNLVGPAAPNSVTVLSFYGQYSEYQDGGFTGGVQLSIPIR